ncbi:phosphoribosyltransferase [Raineyella sp. W15-4]|uniref:phosphoribosyltransferase n=1 Tax=Raineyella sp. W15-4 TaxID=3081651 RepID=UPI002954CD5E|nr:phosphoribosyltransferase [Raineyella sp. W15-4]WOQ16057.1 phosphoribosyltransferase [Raineyella sp. W15-4]
MSEEHEVLTYPDFGIAVREVAQMIVDDGFTPDIIMCIARGGLPFGGALGYALDIKQITEMNVEFYTGINDRLPAPILLPPSPQPHDLRDLKVLIADDVSDTGTTLRFTQDFLHQYAAETRTAVIYEKPHTRLHADFVWRYTDRWIDFPWSTLPPVTRRGRPEPELTEVELTEVTVIEVDQA